MPVFAINFGRIGFLATVDRDDLPRALELALTGRVRGASQLPALLIDGHSASERFAINEVSFQRRPHMNITHLSYSLAGEWVARVPCDGLIAATPAGSTAYSLSVGGPIVAWGVKGFVVNLIAPHALSSRALVAAPEDVLRVVNDGAEPVDIVIDGIAPASWPRGDESEITFTADVVGLAQLPGLELLPPLPGEAAPAHVLALADRSRRVRRERTPASSPAVAGTSTSSSRPASKYSAARLRISFSVPTSPTAAVNPAGTCSSSCAGWAPPLAALTSSPNPAAVNISPYPSAPR